MGISMASRKVFLNTTVMGTPFGDMLRQLRSQKDMSGEELAGATGISQGSISKYERGLNIPRRERITKIAQALDEPEGPLLRAAGLLPPDGDPLALEVQLIFADMSEDDRRIYLDLGKKLVRKKQEQRNTSE